MRTNPDPYGYAAESFEAILCRFSLENGSGTPRGQERRCRALVENLLGAIGRGELLVARPDSEFLGAHL
jgi:hypothetical protein